MKKIKLCIISHFGYPLYNKECKALFGGGAEVQLYLLSKEFAKEDYLDVNILNGEFNSAKSTIEIFENIKIYKVLPIKRKFINYPIALFKFFKFLKIINPDIIIQRAAGVITGLSALFSFLFKKKFIYSISSKSNVDGSAVKGILGKIYMFGLNRASYIIAQNNEQVKLINRLKKLSGKNIKVINSGYEIEDKKIKNKNFILWVGRAIQLKQPEKFINLANKFPKEKFLMICYKDYDEDYWKKIYTKSLNIPNLKFFNFIPFHNIDTYFQESKIFINTSKYEGFPNTFIQAFKNKTPIVSLNVDPDNILTKNKIGFFCDDDFSKMEDFVKLLLEDNEIFESYSNNAYFYAKNNHEIKEISNEWVKLIKQIS